LARKTSKVLTDGELKIMDVIWDLEEASVRDVTEVLNKSQSAAYKTVQTMLRVLESKGYVEHFVSGKTYIYKALVERKKARNAAINQLLSNFFQGSRQSLVVNLLEDEALDASELAQIKDFIKKSKT